MESGMRECKDMLRFRSVTQCTVLTSLDKASSM